MRSHAFANLVLSMIVTGCTHAGEKTPSVGPSPDPPAAAQGNATRTAGPAQAPAPVLEVTRDVWIDQMKTALPTALCGPADFFRQCFLVTAEQCEQTLASTVRLCLAKVQDQIPEKLHQPEDGTKWGSEVGACAGSSYELVLAAKKINSDKCNNPAAWR